MAAIRRYPIFWAFVGGMVLGALFLVLRVSGPGWLRSALGLLWSLLPVAAIVFLVSAVAKTAGLAAARPVAVVTGLWVGFFVGWFGLGLATCAFCLS
ncbi:MAG TPA: hypothetical protein VFS32_04725 [Candidatus Limnocylindrales bacterium]|nr:hypothetical protein [Candidatus Limnocylindrales bacterium]